MIRTLRLLYRELLCYMPLVRFRYKGKSCLDNRGGTLRLCSARIEGVSNRVVIHKGCFLQGCRFFISGSGNVVEIGEQCRLKNVIFWMEDSHNKIIIGDRTSFHGECQLAAIEGSSIRIGRDCLFAPDIHVRTGDSHSVLDEEGNRINPSADVTVCDHVWVGQGVTITKGVSVAEDCVIGTGAVVTRKVEEPRCIAAGVPAKIIKRNISWCAERR